jgi:DNA processing protein
MTQGHALGLARWAAVLNRDLQRAARALGGAKQLWAADPTTLSGVLRIPPERAGELVALRAAHRTEAVLEELATTGIAHLCAADDAWPRALNDLPDAPFGLFVRDAVGAPLTLLSERPAIALVGSRRATPQGIALARSLAGDLARAGAVVVSGLAHGIDAAAHEGALASGGETIAVMGCGVDVVYPRRHRRLAERIAATGHLVSEFWPGTAPAPWRFPARNRIVAGLCAAVAVVEAGERSGALITADFALELGRPVFAVPCWPGTAASAGCNALLRAGAALLEGAEDIVAELPGLAWRQGGEGLSRAPLTGLERRVYECLAHEPLPADLVALRVGEDAAAVASSLALLEVEGIVIRGDGQRYWAATAPGS